MGCSEEQIAHYGVLGMKWGVRRATRRDPGIRAARERITSDRKRYKKSRSDYKDLYSRTSQRKERELKTLQLRKSVAKYQKRLSEATAHAIAGDSLRLRGYDSKANKQYAKADKLRTKWKPKIDQALAEIGDINVRDLQGGK